MTMGDDRFYKVRPLFQLLNKANKDLNMSCKEYYSITEIMVAYYGQHRDKQYISGKPVRFGFKLWTICTSDGFLHHVKPYCGSHTKISDLFFFGLGQGANLVLYIIEKIGLKPGQHAIFDN